ncbi:uncharacterized protein LOC110727699 [Chenopodium quinoa]|uniref:uncharacterized protein LOC110727699 n=1 Tax=Chenopodium quinoa TaxID=63459 RepID=UPI000B7920AD|nr:uncharacterized protein LOC110727699 [Chenopodium quinoa]
MRDWGNLVKEIVTKIVEHVEFYEDFETLQKICRHWRLAAKAAKLRANVKESHTLPWLMLSENEKDAYSTRRRRLYSLSKKMVYQVNLPKYFLKIRRDPKRLLSSYGWLLVLSERGHVSLLNPYSNVIIKLPNIHNYNHADECCKFTLSANPSTTSDFIVFVSFAEPLCTGPPPSNLVYWRNGDASWIRVTNPYVPDPYFGLEACSLDSIEKFLFSVCLGVTFYQGEFYGTNIYGWIVKFETAQGSPHFRAVTNLSYIRRAQEAKSPSNKGLITLLGHFFFYYLVKSQGQLLIIGQVVRYFAMKYKPRRCTTRFELLELNVDNGKVKEVSRLGNRAFFIGPNNSSFSVEVSPSLANGFMSNCVYFVDIQEHGPCKGPGRDGRDHCVYNLASSKFERRFYNDHSSDVAKYTPFTWVESPNS